MYLGGKGAGLTAISGIDYRIKAARTTATTGGGSVITPTHKGPGVKLLRLPVRVRPQQDLRHLAQASSTLVACVPARLAWWLGGGKWDHARCEGGANQSLDVFSASGTLSLNFELNVEHTE